MNHAPQAPMDEQEIVRDVKKKERRAEILGMSWAAFWWTMAILLHVAAVFCVIYFTPLREYMFGKSQADQLDAIKGERMRSIMRQLLSVHTRHVREKVVEFQDIAGKLAAIRDERHARYREQAEAERKDGFDTPAPEPLSVLGDTDAPQAMDVRDMNLLQLYDASLAIEKTAYSLYRHLRATELARIQGLSLTEAGDATKVARPAHPQVRQEVFLYRIEEARDPRFAEFKEEILKVRLEVQDMVAAAKRMLDTAREMAATDLIGARLMRLVPGSHNPGVGVWGSNVGPPLEGRELYRRGGRDGDFSTDFSPKGGRKLMEGGLQGDWMFLDTWYIIGPFPNPNRMYLDKKFPPESESEGKVDLDATYIGKDGLTLAWEYKTSAQLMVTPRVVDNYAIWYAYTEIYSEKDQEPYMIFGSDDYSRIWVNGRKIWSSGKTPHKWIPDRGFMKVKLDRGFNRMLVKIENGPGTMGFSVAIYLGDAPAGGTPKDDE